VGHAKNRLSWQVVQSEVKWSNMTSHKTSICVRTVMIASSHNGPYTYIPPYVDGRKPDPYQGSSDKAVVTPTVTRSKYPLWKESAQELNGQFSHPFHRHQKLQICSLVLTGPCPPVAAPISCPPAFVRDWNLSHPSWSFCNSRCPRNASIRTPV